MELQEKLTALRGIANTPANMLSLEDKMLVSRLAKEEGVSIRRKNCNSCYIDAAVELFGKLFKESAEDAPKEDGRKYVLRAGVNVLYNGIPVNEAAITDEMAEALIKAGFSKEYFSKLPTNEN